MTNNKLIAKDGSIHTDLVSYDRANEAYDKARSEQAIIIKNLEKQNILIRNQINQQKWIKEEEIRLERDKMTHEEEMRINNLFDEIGISRNVFDKFVHKTLFIPNNISNNLEQSKKQLYLVESLLQAENNEDIKSNIICYEHEASDLYYEIREQCYNIDEKEQENLIKQLSELKDTKTKTWIKTIIKLLISTVLLFILLIPIGNILGDILNNKWMIPFYSILGWIIYVIVIISKLQSINKKIKSKENLIGKANVDEKKYMNKVKHLINEAKKEVDKQNNQILHIIKPRIDNFNEFRLNHYNAKIEKLLLDIKFNETISSFGLDYVKVNSSNKVKNGTLEDYIVYFDEFI